MNLFSLFEDFLPIAVLTSTTGYFVCMQVCMCNQLVFKLWTHSEWMKANVALGRIFSQSVKKKDVFLRTISPVLTFLQVRPLIFQSVQIFVSQFHLNENILIYSQILTMCSISPTTQ